MANINWITVGLLVISNLIMLYAWYGRKQARFYWVKLHNLVFGGIYT